MTELSEAARASLARYRDAFAAASIPSVIVPGVVSPAIAAGLRARLSERGLEPFHLAHRGRYAFDDGLVDAGLFGGLVALAEFLSGERLAIDAARWVRLVRGDYALMRDDAAPLERHLEMTLDVSEVASGGAEVCYCHRGALFLAVPQVPGSAALIERGPTVRRYDRYLSHRVGDAEVVRLRLALRGR